MTSGNHFRRLRINKRRYYPDDQQAISIMHSIYHREAPGENSMNDIQFTIDVAQKFQQRMGAILNAVQTGVWQAGVHDLLGSATDYGFGQKRGLQTLVLKTGHRSAYVRLHWDEVLGDSEVHRVVRDNAVLSAIRELT
jgi:hypothetical protein